MTECYELPVLFTEEERKAYADWGMKKEKALMPFAVATILIYIVAAVLVGWRVWGHQRRGSFVVSDSGAESLDWRYYGSNGNLYDDRAVGTAEPSVG